MTHSIPRVTWDHLLNLAAKYPPEIASRQSAVNFVTALAVVKHFMGQAWVERYTSPFDSRPGYFRLRIDEGDPLGARTGQRLVDLGELFFNLQHIEGFDACIERMRQGTLEATEAELSIGGMLYVNDWPFRFVEPTGTKRGDYDYEITYRDGWKLCADTKCKIESTALSSSTILNALKKGHSQLPNDCPGVVFVKFPAVWLTDPAHRPAIGGAVHEFFGSRSRVVSVVFYTTTRELKDTAMTLGHRFLELQNVRNKFDGTRDWRLFNVWKPPEGAANGLPPKWRRFINFPHGF